MFCHDDTDEQTSINTGPTNTGRALCGTGPRPHRHVYTMTTNLHEYQLM